MCNHPDITEGMCLYASEIFRLQETFAFVPPSELEYSLNVSAQAVARMLRRMKAAGLVEHVRYKGVRLTPKGVAAALPCIRRHRLTEVFLVDVMGFGWDEVHDLADRFVQGVDDVLEARMAEMTNHPTRCPHGEPIPTPEGEMPPLNDEPLAGVDVGRRLRLSRVRTHDREILRYLGALGLRPGVEMRLEARAPFDGPVRLRYAGNREAVLGQAVVSVLWVERLD
ncbi:DtxR family transcriptional regulator, Mn-dependent transcriptional regulator [Ardenticatena maritima]|uniref:Manganese transport regulator n=1 Tax=Ardenticatena maritima TaxID=872965 RepID=A0A0M9UDE2_9CHLR|nr:metal-dependent transcriptional regulator [Ardenticatena maritima]KPL89300.1 hypothetical protein SE16_02165 [Ardenticatena maritima]GAP63938.1 DtxR family transcriptional regulator, Mn-dependent transcriptional regulator [Ardenticatena maritima]